MVKLTAIYRENRNGDLHSITYDDYKNKAAFASDVRRNGLRVVAILNENEIELMKNREMPIDQLVKYDAVVEYVRQCL
jgi:hypothetical protein